MIQIKTRGHYLDLPKGFVIDIEDTSPIYNDRGSQSIPVTVPTTRRNIALLDAPHRIDAGIDPNSPECMAEIVAGAYIRSGTMNIINSGKIDGITFNIGFDNSTAYVKWSQKKLAELSDLPTYMPQEQPAGYPIDWLLDELYRVYQTPNPKSDDFAVFPLAINSESIGSDEDQKTYWEVLNLPGDRGLAQPTKVSRLIDGEVTEISVPEGYCVSPFLRVWRVIELIFDDLGMKITSNPFKNDVELSRLVVLNNVADSCCKGSINYADLMPDCTVDEFLNALWVRFGLVYNVDNNTGYVTLRLLKDIITQKECPPLENLATEPEKIIYKPRQYVRLSAKKSIEGAAPSHERFEDFAKGLDVSQVRLGTDVSQWQMTGLPEDPRWDGDVRDDWRDDPENPDEGDDRDESDDSDYYAARGAAKPGARSATPNTSFLAREFITGQWYHLDAFNGNVRLSSSSFFNWDPQPEGVAPLDLSSDDEFVPVNRVSNVGTGTGNTFNDRCPLYLFGARHYHSYIKSGDDSEESGDKTPLAFMFAYTKGNVSFGRINGEGDDGKPITLDDGTVPTVSLLFQFKDGLFARYWAFYDEILRHGNRIIEVNVRMNKLDLFKIDLLKVFTFKGVRCLIDSMAYTLPSGKDVSVDLKLRTIQTQGVYDIDAEQRIPDFAAASRHLKWEVLNDTYGPELDTMALRAIAADKYINTSGYEPHGTIGDYWYVGPEGTVLKELRREALTWENDTSLPSPETFGQRHVRTYRAIMYYGIFEIHDRSTGSDTPPDLELSSYAIGFASMTVDYTVELTAVWANG